jgi:hypothetical protein
MSRVQLFLASIALLRICARSQQQILARCKLTLIGHSSSNLNSSSVQRAGVSAASLHCSNANTPITIVFNSTYLGVAAVTNFSVVTVVQDARSCSSSNADTYNHPLLQFCESYSVLLEQPVVRNVWLQDSSSNEGGWSSAVLAFGAGVRVSIVGGVLVGNAATHVLLASRNANVSVVDSLFIGSVGTAAAAIDNSRLSVSSSVFEENHGHMHGGAFWISGASFVSINSSIMRDNKGPEGPCMYVERAATVRIDNSMIIITDHSDASAALDIAGSARLSINNCTFHNNSTPLKVDKNDNGFGGVLALEEASSAVISSSRFVSNAGGFGGVIYMEAKSLTVTDCEFRENSGYHGGVAHIKGDTQVSLPDGMVSNCCTALCSMR